MDAATTSLPGTVPASPGISASLENSHSSTHSLSKGDRGKIWFEVCAVFALAVLPMLFSASSKVIFPEIAIQKPFAYTGWYIVLRSLWISLPVLFIIHASHSDWSVFGLSRPKLLEDVPGGIAVWLVGYAACYAFWTGYYSLVDPAVGATGNPMATFSRPEGIAGITLLIAASLGNGFMEELIFRGYLMSRLEQLLGSVAGLYLTTGLFAAVHVYQGAGGVLTTAVLGLVYGSAFYYTRRLWPIALAHAIADFAGFIALI